MLEKTTVCSFRLAISLIISSILYLPFSANSSPWIDSSNSQLYYDVITLTEWGYIDVATSSFPLPWKGIAEQLNQLNTALLTDSASIAFYRLKHVIESRQLQKKSTRTLRFNLASKDTRFSHFSTQFNGEAQISLTQQFNSATWSAQISINHEENGKSHFDQSYISYQFDNWLLRIGSQSQWWGPAMSSSLILSNNARPIPAIALSRSQAVVSQNSWLKFLGPWYVTAQLGQLEHDRAIPKTKLWLSRFSFKPTKNLEIGASWSAMWGGKGQGNSLSDMFDVLTFKAICVNGAKHCDDSLHTKQGNHLAGFDLKYSFMLFEQPVNLYAQRIGEDAIDYYRVTDQANLFGISSYIGNTRIYIESSDTNVACGNDQSTTKNCYYEHSTYQSGYRYNQRAIGSTFDSDAKMLTVGLNRHFIDGDVIESFFRSLNLNQDQQTPSPVVNGSTEKLLQLGGFYQTTLGNWRLKLGGELARSKVNNQDKDTNYMFYSEVQYRLN